MSVTGLLHSPADPVLGHSSAPRTAGVKPFGAPMTNTVPVTVPGAGGGGVAVLHELPLEPEPALDPELPLDPEQHVLELPLEPELPARTGAAARHRRRGVQTVAESGEAEA